MLMFVLPIKKLLSSRRFSGDYRKILSLRTQQSHGILKPYVFVYISEIQFVETVVGCEFTRF